MTRQRHPETHCEHDLQQARNHEQHVARQRACCSRASPWRPAQAGIAARRHARVHSPSSSATRNRRRRGRRWSAARQGAGRAAPARGDTAPRTRAGTWSGTGSCRASPSGSGNAAGGSQRAGGGRRARQWSRVASVSSITRSSSVAFCTCSSETSAPRDAAFARIGGQGRRPVGSSGNGSRRLRR